MTLRSRVAVTGATGFIGRHVVEAITRSRAVVVPISRSGVGHQRAALNDPVALAAVFEGCTAVVHCATSSSSDPDEQERVTVRGTAAVVEAARAAGAGRVVLLSTTAVYGYGPFRMAAAGTIAPAPASVRSAARLRAESFAEDGDVIVRPNLVYGEGDTTFVPTLLRAVEGGRDRTLTAAVSVVHVRDLAVTVAEVAREAGAVPPLLHVAHPVPVRLETVVNRLRREGVDVHAPLSTELTPHQQSMLMTDSMFEPTGRWGVALGTSGTEPLQLRPRDLIWYRGLLGPAA